MNIEARIKHLEAIKEQCDKEIAQLKPDYFKEPELVVEQEEPDYFAGTIINESEIETAAIFEDPVINKPKRKKNV